MSNIRIANGRIEIPLSDEGTDNIIREALKDARQTILKSIDEDIKKSRKLCDENPKYIWDNLQDSFRYLEAMETALEWFE